MGNNIYIQWDIRSFRQIKFKIKVNRISTKTQFARSKLKLIRKKKLGAFLEQHII